MKIDNIDQAIEKYKGKFSWRFFSENFVFKEGSYFYKTPSFIAKKIFYRKINSYDRIYHCLEIIQKYFGSEMKIADTKIIQLENGHYMVVQKQIIGEKISFHMVKSNPLIKSRFKKFVELNELMWKEEGFFLDLLGSDFIFRPLTIHNLITDGKDIYIFDFGLFEKSPKSKTFKYFSHLAKNTQIFFIKRLLKD